jgi:FixJ family two-component response regulator
MSSGATIFLVDDDNSVRLGLARMLQSAGLLVESFSSGEDFLARYSVDPEGCLILDLRMPALSGAEVQKRLKARGSDLPVIFLSGHGQIPDSVRAIRDGAADFLTKPVDEAVLLAAIARALESQRALRQQRREVAQIQQRLAALTAREHDVLRHVISGALNKQIANRLGIAEGTVKIHRGRVMDKLGVGSVAELVRLCETAGIQSE